VAKQKKLQFDGTHDELLLKTTVAMLAELRAMRSELFKVNAAMLSDLRAILREQRRDPAFEAMLRQLERSKKPRR
jgi:hypothetical protein